MATCSLLALCTAAPLARAAESGVTRGDAADDEPIGAYLGALEAAGRLRPEAATPERLRELLIEAEARLVKGDARAATTLLFGVVESPRFAALASTPAYQNAEFLLGRALFVGRAYRSAERYLARVIARGRQGSYFVPAMRVLTDLALDTRRYAAVLALAERAAGGGALPDDVQHELSYLRGRAAYAAGQYDEAAAELRQVGRASRLYPAAQYFRGLAAVQARAYDDARDAFCTIADQRDQDRVTFNVDARYFRLKDLARLALGRLAHERDAYDEAYYFYFAIPEDSPRLASALFEASWSMLQKGEFTAARAFADQFDRLFPDSPLRPEVSILRAHLAVKTCAFDRARAEARAVELEFGPVHALALAAAEDAALRGRLVDRLLRGEAGKGQDPEGQLLAILRLDEGFGELVTRLADVDADLAEATAAVRLWRELGARAEAARAAAPAPASAEAITLLEDTASLLDAAPPGSPEWRQIADLALEVSLVAYPPEHAGPYVAEAQAAETLARELSALRADLVSELRDQAATAIAGAAERLRGVLGETRLVHIDAVVGKKKKLEVEIRKLTDGTLTPEVFGKLAVEGVIGDDEIYWPYEGELWADEYENYR